MPTELHTRLQEMIDALPPGTAFFAWLFCSIDSKHRCCGVLRLQGRYKVALCKLERMLDQYERDLYDIQREWGCTHEVAPGRPLEEVTQ